jgi:hypothetical protein
MTEGNGLPAAERRHLGAGEYLVRLPAGDEFAFRVDAPDAKVGWRPRRGAEATLAEFAGTAVVLEGELYEVARAEPASTGTGWSYWLRSWDGCEPIRGLVHYGVEEVAREAAELAGRRQRQRAGALLAVAAPLVGLLPGADQRRLELQLGFSAARATLIGAVLGLGVSFGVFMIGMAQSLAPQEDPSLTWTVDARPAALYFVVESLVRLWVALQLGEPMGSLPVWLPVSLVRAVRGSLHSPARAVDGRELRRRREMWVETLEPVLGLLEHDMQSRLAESFPAFDQLRATRSSVLGQGVFAVLSVLVAGSYLVSDPRVVDAVVLVGAGALGLEAWSRHAAWRLGRVRGSVLGALLRPLARRLLA